MNNFARRSRIICNYVSPLLSRMISFLIYISQLEAMSKTIERETVATTSVPMKVLVLRENERQREKSSFLTDEITDA